MVVETNSSEYNGAPLEVVVISLLALTTFSVLLRFYCRIFLVKSFWSDDWLMLASQMIYTLLCTQVLLGIHAGLGHHNAFLSQRKEIEALKWENLSSIVYVLNMMFIKLSIGIFLHRIAVLKRYIWIIRITLAVIFIVSTVIIFYLIFQCKPLPLQWDYTLEGVCISGDSFVMTAITVSIMTISSDWLFAILPIIMIWKVRMSLQKKITVGIVLSLGIFASVATLIRFKYMLALADYTDQLYTATNALTWTMVEPGIAIIAASLVTIRPLLQKLNFSGFGSSKSSPGYNPSGEGRGVLSLRGDIPRSSQWHSDVESQGGTADSSKGGIQLPKSESRADRTKGVAASSPAGRHGGSSRVKGVTQGDNESEEYILQGVLRPVDVAVVRNGARDYRTGERVSTSDMIADHRIAQAR